MKSAEQKPRIGNGFAKEKKEPPLSAERTTPPGHYVVLYDGFCKFCVAGANKMKVLARPGAIELLSFQEPGVLDRFPGVTRNACMRQMQLITPEGKVVGGLEAAVQAVATRPIMRFLVYAYYLPGVRFLGDRIYAFLAAHRYHIMGKVTSPDGCEQGTCFTHFQQGKKD